jgi:NAD(P)-dependent dehydrogenase (short-subunit alcohol dehydrogenase family)
VTAPVDHFPGRFAGKRAVVTGAASGIGRACATRLADEGAQVALVDRSDQRLQEATDEIRAGGGTARDYRADCSVEAEIKAALDGAADAMGGIDVLVASAGIELADRDARLDELTVEAWDALLTTNLTGQFLSCKHSLRHMLAGRGGAVVCVGSNTGSLGLAPREPAYSASKGGIFAMMKVAAIDFARLGIRVNMVVPGFIDTPMNAHVMRDPTELAYWADQVPLGRAGSAEEVAAAALWLASDEASYCIGTALVVDGGQSSI